MAGLTAPSGGIVTCTIQPASSDSVFDPVKVVITNFEAISQNTKVEIHLVGIGNIRSIYNDGSIWVSSEMVLGDGKKVQLIKESLKKQPVSQTYTMVPTDVTDSPTIQPASNRVADHMTYLFTFELLNTLSAGDYFAFTFHFQYQLKYQSDSQIFGVVSFKKSGVTKTVALETVIYASGEQVNRLYFRVPAGQSIDTAPASQNVSLTVARMRNAAYA